MKEIVILGGPNGAGKTTAARVLLREFLGLHAFVNADELARSINAFTADLTPLAAGRLMLTRLREVIAQEVNLAIETTCAGRSYVPVLSKCKSAGWRITLIYLWLPSPEIAVARVARRVREGGHGVPADAIRRRFHAGLRNLLGLYLPLADTAAIYDNGGAKRVLIAEREFGRKFLIHDQIRWKAIGEQAKCN